MASWKQELSKEHADHAKHLRAHMKRDPTQVPRLEEEAKFHEASVKGCDAKCKIHRTWLWKAEKPGPEWLGRPIEKPEHARDLERAAAINEFDHQMPRSDAEHKAHKDYIVQGHRMAAAHHLNGIKLARANGAVDESKQHAELYGLAIRAMGQDPSGSVPPEVKAAALALQESGKPYRFQPHFYDQFLVNDPKK